MFHDDFQRLSGEEKKVRDELFNEYDLQPCTAEPYAVWLSRKISQQEPVDFSCKNIAQSYIYTMCAGEDTIHVPKLYGAYAVDILVPMGVRVTSEGRGVGHNKVFFYGAAGRADMFGNNLPPKCYYDVIAHLTLRGRDWKYLEGQLERYFQDEVHDVLKPCEWLKKLPEPIRVSDAEIIDWFKLGIEEANEFYGNSEQFIKYMSEIGNKVGSKSDVVYSLDKYLAYMRERDMLYLAVQKAKNS